MLERAGERVELRFSELAGGDERSPRHRAREADDRARPAELDVRKVPGPHVDCDVDVALGVLREELREAPSAQRAPRVGVVVAGDDADVAGGEVELALEDLARREKLRFEGEVRDVSGDHHVIDLGPRDLSRHRADVLGPVDVLLAQALRESLGSAAPGSRQLLDGSASKREVRDTRETLVHVTRPTDPIEREDVEIREVRDPHQSAAQRKPTYGSRRTGYVIQREALRWASAPCMYEPPRMTCWEPVS